MRRTLLVTLSLVLIASGCSLGPREDWIEAMRGAYATAREAGGAHVRQSVSVRVIETNIRQDPKPLIARSQGTATFASRRASMVGTGERKTKVIYDDLAMFAQRSKASAAIDRKSWAWFDYEAEPDVDIDDNDRRMAVGAGLISPVVALEVLQGVLTGSLEREGTGQKAGVPATRYSGRLAPDAAVTEIRDEDRQEGVERMFATLGVQQDDFPVDVWLDDEDRVRGVQLHMRQQKDRVNAFALTVSWEFTDYSPTPPIELPSRDDAVRPTRFREFVTELIREFG
jgi:hypothetical protein